MISKTPQSDSVVTPELVKQHGLTPEEFEKIKKILGREPNFTELGIFSVMWSEHCSYKNSRKELKKLPTTGANILVKAGEENAGVVDIGDGWAIAFKIESHNHPSAIEPFQGGANQSIKHQTSNIEHRRQQAALHRCRLGYRALRQLRRHSHHRGRDLFR